MIVCCYRYDAYLLQHAPNFITHWSENKNIQEKWFYQFRHSANYENVLADIENAPRPIFLMDFINQSCSYAVIVFK
jgi:hypothetical protein